MGKQSLIPTAGRRKGACNCLCFQACRAVGFAACILWKWFPQQPDLQGGYCKLLVARGKATQASLLLERNGNRDTPAPSSTSRTRKGLTAGRPRWGPWRGWVGGWIRALVRGARGSACRWCDPSDPEPSERPWQASKQEPCPCSKGRCGSAGAGNSGAGESPGGAESPWRFWQGCCTQGPVGSTGPSELAASLTQGRGASKIETADKNQNFCLKSLAFAFIALPPGMGRFQGSWFLN